MLKKQSFPFFILIVISLASYSQAPSIQWEKSLGGSGQDDASSIQQTLDGGYIVAGITGSNDGDVSGNHGGDDAWVVKLDSEGLIVWQKCIGGTDDDPASFIALCSDGGYILAGNTDSNDDDMTGNHGGGDAFLVKLDNSGTIQWHKCYGGSQEEWFDQVEQTSDGGYIAVGTTTSNDGDVSGLHTPPDAEDYWVVKTDSNGAIQWQECLGGYNIDFGSSIQQTKDGGYIVAGFSDSKDGDVTGLHGNVYDYWVAKLDSSGSIKWEKCLGGSLEEKAYSVIQTKDAGFILAGYTFSDDGDVSGKDTSLCMGAFQSSDYWVVKIDSEGNFRNQRCLGGSCDEIAYSISQTNDGGYVVTGYTSSTDGEVIGNHGGYDYWTVKLDSSLNIEWSESNGGSHADEANAVIQSRDGGYVIAGQGGSDDGDETGYHGAGDAWIVKLSPKPMGVADVQSVAKEIKIYPNPSNGLFHVQNSVSNEIEKTQVFNYIGEVIFYKIGKTEEIDLSNAASGIYFYSIQTKAGNVYTGKIVKE